MPKSIIKGLYWTVEVCTCSARIDKIPCKIFSSHLKEQGILVTAVGVLGILQLFSQGVGQHWTGLPRRHRAAGLLGWLHVPGWETEQEFNKLNKEFLSSLFSSLMVNKGLPLQILWTCEHGNRREKYNTFCASGTNWKSRNLKAYKVSVHVSNTLFVSLPIYVKEYFRPPTLFGSN